MKGLRRGEVKIKDYYEINYNSLVERDPSLTHRLKEGRAKIRIERLTSKVGLPTARVSYNSNRPILLHSLYDPEKEASRAVEKANLEEKNLIIILGFGLGYYSLEVFRRNPMAYLIIIEEDPSLLKTAMESLDLRPLFSSRRVVLLVGMAEEEVRRSLVSIIKRLLEVKSKFLVHPSVFQLNQTYYGDIAHLITSKWDLGDEESYSLNDVTGYYKNLPARVASYSPDFQQEILRDSILKTGLDSKARVLDLCSGGGSNLSTLLLHFSRIVAMDISREALGLSRARYPGDKVHYEVGDARHIPFDDRFFDLVVCTEALELIPDSERVIQEIDRVLKEKGYIMISTPNYNNPMGLIKKRRDRILKAERWNPWGINIRGGFERHFTPARLRSLLEDRFRILQTRGADYILAWLFWTKLTRFQLRYPGLGPGRLPGLKAVGMHYYILAQKR